MDLVPAEGQAARTRAGEAVVQEQEPDARIDREAGPPLEQAHEWAGGRIGWEWGDARDHRQRDLGVLGAETSYAKVGEVQQREACLEEAFREAEVRPVRSQDAGEEGCSVDGLGSNMVTGEHC